MKCFLHCALTSVVVFLAASCKTGTPVVVSMESRVDRVDELDPVGDEDQHDRARLAAWRVHRTGRMPDVRTGAVAGGAVDQLARLTRWRNRIARSIPLSAAVLSR